MKRPEGRLAVTSALGVTQILAWGSSYHLPAVLAKPIAADTGWSLAWVVSGLSVGLLTSALVASFTGAAIQRWGGRPVLAASSILLSAALLTIAAAPNLAVYLLAWVIMGLGMSTGLYEAVFGTLGRLYGKDARGAITAITMWGGLAGTVCWPLGAFLAETYGWRVACLILAGIQILICLPCFAFFVPSTPSSRAKDTRHEGKAGQMNIDMPLFYLLGGVIALSALVSSMLIVNLLTILQLRGMDLVAAVAVGALMGPAQLGARIAEMFYGRRYHAIWTMIVAVVFSALGVGLLWSGMPITALAIVVYSIGNGIQTIARGAVPLALFDPQHYPTIIGRLARPSLVVQALAPSLGAVILEKGGASNVIGVLFAASLANIVLVFILWRRSRRSA